MRLTKEAGISVFAYFILGLPGENWNTINRTIKFAIKLDPDYANFHIATPFPGTELYQICKTNNWLTSDVWADYEEEGSAVIRTKELSTKDLIKAQKTAMRKFYMRPSKIIHQLFKVRNINDLRVRVGTALKLVTGL